jgi:hypothetical protein
MATTTLYHGWTHDEVYAFICTHSTLTDAEIAAYFVDRTELGIAILRAKRARKIVRVHEQSPVRVVGDDRREAIPSRCTFETLLAGHARCPMCNILSCHGKGKSHCLLKKGETPVVCDWCRERGSALRESLVTLCAIQSSMDFGLL